MRRPQFLRRTLSRKPFSSCRTLSSEATYAELLDTCLHKGQLPQGRQIHSQILVRGLPLTAFLATKLVTMYHKCGSLNDARILFNGAPDRSIFLWNAIIRGLARNHLNSEAMEAFSKMQRETPIRPDNYTFPLLLKAAAGLWSPRHGQSLHVLITRSGFDSDIFVMNALLSMYCKFGLSEDARQMFDKMPHRDVVTWNSIISGFVQNADWSNALEFYSRMIDVDKLEPDAATITTVLSACAGLGDVRKGKEIHHYIAGKGIEGDVIVGNALIAMYAKCNEMDMAVQVLEKMCERDVITWTSIIGGFVDIGDAFRAMRLFEHMQNEGIQPNYVTVISVLPACAHLASLDHGREIHGFVFRNGYHVDSFVASSLIDMYAKCGSISSSVRVFEKFSPRDLASWNALIAGHGMHGHGEEALGLFMRMKNSHGIVPDDITFVTVLSACSRAGMVEEGKRQFSSMVNDYGIKPRMNHYACMVDLLGRAGNLEEAYDFILKMPFTPNVDVWGALLGACKIHQNIPLGEIVAEKLFELRPKTSGFYVLMSNIYAAAGNWSCVRKVREFMKDRGVFKTPAYSWIEVEGEINSFMSWDRAHPRLQEIHLTLEHLFGNLKTVGFIPDTSFVLQDVEEEEKENVLLGHSEKLAFAFAVIALEHEVPIRITKNLRMCGDCHNFMKHLSAMLGRELIVRDLNRFHHITNGLCSCGDYW